jgi:hypothetical protein
MLRWMTVCSAGNLSSPLEACLLRWKPVFSAESLSSPLYAFLFLQDAVCAAGCPCLLLWKPSAYAFSFLQDAVCSAGYLSVPVDACLLRWIPVCSAGSLSAPLETFLLCWKPVCSAGSLSAPLYAFLFYWILSAPLDACLLLWPPRRYQGPHDSSYRSNAGLSGEGAAILSGEVATILSDELPLSCPAKRGTSEYSRINSGDLTPYLAYESYGNGMEQKESVAVSLSHQIRAEDDWAELSVKSWLRLSTPVPA